MNPFTTVQRKKALVWLSLFHLLVITSSNYLVQLPISIFGFHTTWGAFSFPFIFLATDLTVRIFGAPLARRIIFAVMVPALAISYGISALFYMGEWQGFAALEHAVDIGIAALCAEAVGVMDKTVAITVEYMNQRKQFGVTIASFQALRHRIADVKMQLELARSMAYYTSLKLNAPTEERRRAMARAKYQLGNSMRLVGQQAVQLHGGIGVTDEYIVSHYFKRLTQMEMTFGDTLHQLGEVSKRMQDTAGVFA